MVKVSIIKNGQIAGGATWKSKEEADAWIEKQEKRGSWGKKAYTVVTTEPLEGASNTEKVKGPMGMDAYKNYFPAEYEIKIEYINEKKIQADECFKKIREERDELLKNTDYTQLADAPMESKEKKIYREYRHYLRQLPSLLDDIVVLNYKIKTYEEFKKER